MTHNTKQMTVKEAAAKYNQPPRKLLDALRKKFPEDDWTLDSLLPDNFEDMVEQHRQEYVETFDSPESQLPKGEITTTAEAVKDNALMLEAIEYGVLESLSQIRRSDVAYMAQVDAITDIQTYETTYANVWTGYYNNQVTKRQERIEQIGEQLKTSMISRNETLGKQQGALVVGKMEANLKQTKRQMELDGVIEALNQPTAAQ
ncbi:MAG: hypothetical protein KME46_21890 [Brasilonema angustatum HA4187-MV1]|nr:hypothetical protein [Brasilonema angustatum HA4187-MV1]